MEPHKISGPKQPTTLRFLLLALASAGALGGVILMLTAPDPGALPAAQAQAPMIAALRLAAHPLAARAKLSGLLEPSRQVDLFAEVDGRVTEVGAEELDRVEADQLLLRMDPLLAEIAIKRALAAMERAESQGALAQANLTRNRGLANVNVASRAALDASEDAARQAKASRMEAEAALAEASDRLAKKTVRAPFGGVLRSFPVEEGEYVRPGERVAELLDVEQLEITIGLMDNQVVDVVPGTVVDVEILARPGEAFSGQVTAVGGAVDPETRKFPVQIELDNSAGLLLPGMVAVVELKLGRNHPTITLPLDAVIDAFGLKHVFVLEPEGDGAWIARKRRIEVHSIPFLPTKLAVTSGLGEGEVIAVSSIRQLRDDMPIRVEPESVKQARTLGEPEQ